MITALCVGLLLAGCKRSDDAPLGPPAPRSPPLEPKPRLTLQALGAQCFPEHVVPTECHWSGGGASCSLSYDAADRLRYLRCDSALGIYECRPRGALYACAWSDTPDCADVFLSDGELDASLCGDLLAARLASAGDDDAGAADAGEPALDAQPGPQADASTAPDAFEAPDAGDCTQLDEVRCRLTPACIAFECPTCGASAFAACVSSTVAAPACSPPACPCAALDEMACSVNPACHPYFFDHHLLDAAAGLDTWLSHFAGCDDGPADCLGLDRNNPRTTPCRDPYMTCDPAPGHAAAYHTGCVAGCVPSAACAPAAPIDCAATSPLPGLEDRCFTDAQCAVGMHRLDCCGNARAIGVSILDAARFAVAESYCGYLYFPCQCPSAAITFDDGTVSSTTAQAGVRCVGATASDLGVCRSYRLP